MSLILDALKKIEREKGDAGEKGVLVLGAVPWGERQARKTSLVIGATLGVLGVFALGAVATWWLLRPPRPAAPATTAPAPAGPTSRPAAFAPAPALVHASAPSTASVATPPASAPAGPPSTAPGPAGGAPLPTPSSPPAGATPAEPAPRVPATTSLAPGAPDVRLTAISHRDGQPVALVNDRLVREGDSFDGIHILRIGDAEVEVEVRGQRRVIRF